MNDQTENLCSCMSGKKYEECCKHRTDFISFIKDNFHADYIDAGYIINGLSRDSNLMMKYVRHTFSTITIPIVWAVNPDLSANMRTFAIESNFNIVIIKKAPIESKDIFDAAHELGHVKLGCAGYPGIRSKENGEIFIMLASVTNNVVQDPIINATLSLFGFDLGAYLQKGNKLQLPFIQSMPKKNAMDEFSRHIIKCILIEKIQEWWIKTSKQKPSNLILKYCERSYPDIVKEANSFACYIRRRNPMSPERAREILNELIIQDKMQKYLQVY